MNKLLLFSVACVLLLTAACTTQPPTDINDTQLSQIKFISTDPAQCATIRFTCEEGMMPFSDETGCGCNPVEEKKVPIYCENPRPEVCTLEYMPVCGYMANGTRITGGNGCSVCGNPDVDYYVSGVCPQDLAAV